MDISFYKEQLRAKENMLASTTSFLLQAQRDLREKNKEISGINKSIFESIKFAELIQSSLLPDVDVLRIFLPDAAYSILQQMGIGGDAVFIKNTSQGVIFGLLDATGHGVPAAMLSTGGMLMLNELTSSMDIDSPATLVKLLDYQLNSTFNSSQSIAHMEGVICFFSSKTRTLSYSSAKGKAFHIPLQGEITDLYCTKNPIGENSASEFDHFELDVKKGDKIFLYSDGLTDQFGGDRDKKFSKSRLKQLLADNIQKDVNELKAVIEAEHRGWKNEGSQTDDVSFMIIQF